MHDNLRRREAGFTLVEMLIVVALTSLLMTVLTSAFLISIRAAQSNSKALSSAESSQLVVTRMLQDAQNARTVPSFKPLEVPSGCAGVDPVGSVNLALFIGDGFRANYRFEQVAGAYSDTTQQQRWQLIRVECVAAGAARTTSVTARELLAPSLQPEPQIDAGRVTVVLKTIDDTQFTIRAVSRVLAGAAAPVSASIVDPPGEPQAARTALTVLDTDVDGRVDALLVVYPVTLTDDCLGASRWSLDNIPSGGVKDTVSRTPTSLTLRISEGGGPPTTAVGAFTASFTSPAGCPGEGFTAVTPGDGAAPVLISVITDTASTVGPAVTGYPQRGDRLVMGFSETVQATPSFLSSDKSVTFRRSSGSGNTVPDSLEIAGLLPESTLGTRGYFTNNGNLACVHPGTPAMSAGRLTITLKAAVAGGDCNKMNTAGATAGSVLLPFVSPVDVTDSALNGVLGFPVATSLVVF